MKKLLSRLWQWPVPIHIGLSVCAVGMIVIAFTWAKVARLTSVALQLPYFISGGFTSLALTMTGLTIISLGVRARDEAERRKNLDRLAEILSAVQSHLGDQDK